MKILHIVDEPYDSGIVEYALKAASGLADRGHSCRIWGLRGRYPVEKARQLGIPADAYGHPWLELRALRRLLKKQKHDLVVAHTGSAHTLAVAVAAWHYSVGGQPLPVLRTRGDPRPFRKRPGAGLLWARTAGFAAGNNSILEDYHRHYGGARPAAVVYEGMKDPGPPPPPVNGAPMVGIVARLDPVKGHKYFLQAAAAVLRSCPDAQFMVVGRQENIRSTELLSQAQNLGIADRVLLTGHVPDAREYMKRCHIGVVASIGSEAVSRAAVEWMALGRPLVATSVGCLPEYVAEGRSGYLVAPEDSSALAAAMARLVGDVFLRERLGQGGRECYLERFTFDRFVDETEKLYAQTIHAASSR